MDSARLGSPPASLRNFSSNALRPLAVRAVQSSVCAHDSWAAILARRTRWEGVKPDEGMALQTFQSAERSTSAAVPKLGDTTVVSVILLGKVVITRYAPRPGASYPNFQRSAET